MNLRRHLWIALVIGFLLRMLSMHFVWGPQALDDYLDNLIPAWKALNGMDPDLHDYRSPMYMWILESWLKVGSWVGIENAIPQIKWTYFFQALSSLLAIPGVYLITRKAKSSLVPIFAMYLVAVHGLMPFASTRSFMESFVMGPLTLAIAFLYLAHEEDKNNLKLILSGFFLLGFSVLVRFQLGVVYVAWFLMMCIRKDRLQIIAGFLVGLFLIIAECGIDKFYGRFPFETLYSYIKFSSHLENAPIMPWYNTSLSLLGFLYFPFSFLLWKGWTQALKEYRLILITVFAFVLFHTISPHKEERYLYPILPLALIFLAVAWVAALDSRLVKYGFNWLYIGFNSIVLFVGCFVNTQSSLVEPLGLTQLISNEVLYLNYDDHGMRDNMAEFFVRKPGKMIHPEGAPGFDVVERHIKENPDLKYLMVLSSFQKYAENFENLYKEISSSGRYKCDGIKTATSLSDQILYSLNPRMNDRRLPTQYFVCRR